MSEPTREQIKEAFKKTIERWEKIVERPTYYHESHCALCRVYEGTDVCHKFCPIRDYGDHRICSRTPYHDFTQDKTPANALAELNFLRKVYIWWIEGEGKDSVGEPLRGYEKEEKKEEWKDVTQECTVNIEYVGGYYYFQVFYDGKEVLFSENPSVSISDKQHWDTNLTFLSPYYDMPSNIKVEISHGTFRILKKI